jgi:hypothetical protein
MPNGTIPQAENPDPSRNETTQQNHLERDISSDDEPLERQLGHGTSLPQN